MAGRTFKDALDVLRQINEVHVRGSGQVNQTSIAGFNAWQPFQQTLFFSELRAQPKQKRRPPVRLFLSKLGLVLASVVGVVLLLLSRRRTLVYAIDRLSNKDRSCDFRMEKIYSYLKSRDIRFVEVIHTDTGRWLGNFIRRRRPVIYLEAIDAIFDFLQLFSKPTEPQLESLELEGESREAAFELVRHFLRKTKIAAFRVSLFRKLLRLSAVDRVLAIDDTRHYNELILACRLEKISTTAFQHGHFTRYHVGWLKLWESKSEWNLPDSLVVWSEYWRDELLRLGSLFGKERIVIGGKPYGDPITKSEGSKDSSAITVLIPYENEADKAVVRACIQNLLSLNDVRVVFKTRPDVPSSAQVEEYALPRSQNLIVGTDLSKLPTPDLVIGTYSTFLYEMVEKNIPVAFLRTTNDFGEGLVLNGLADPIDPGISSEDLKQLVHTPTDILEKRREKLLGDSSIDFETTLDRIFQGGGLTRLASATQPSA